jgi:nucleoside-diphosphate-sugar epimerase
MFIDRTPSNKSRTNNDKRTILLAGATGALGSLIANALLDKPDITLRVLVRPGSRLKAAPLAERGAEVMEIAIDDPSRSGALVDAVSGGFSAVSALAGGPDVIIDTQVRLLEASRQAGVKRFIPSDFSYNIFGLADGENTQTDWRRAFARRADEIHDGVEVVHVLNGCLLDRRILFGFLGAFDLASRKAFLWGDGNAPMDFTTYEDTARFTAEAATDPNPLPREFNVAGDTLNFHQLIKAYEGASGDALAVVRMGSLADLDAEGQSAAGRSAEHLCLSAIDVLARNAQRQGQARSAGQQPVSAYPALDRS